MKAYNAGLLSALISGEKLPEVEEDVQKKSSTTSEAGPETADVNAGKAVAQSAKPANADVKPADGQTNEKTTKKESKDVSSEAKKRKKNEPVKSKKRRRKKKACFMMKKPELSDSGYTSESDVEEMVIDEAAKAAYLKRKAEWEKKNKRPRKKTIERVRKEWEKQQKSKKVDEDEQKRTIFVGNLPVNINRPKLKNLFKKYGVVEKQWFRSFGTSNPIITKKDAAYRMLYRQGDVMGPKDSINSYIRFKDVESVEKAMELNNYNLGTTAKPRRIRVDYATPRPHDHERSIFLQSLHFYAQEDDVRACFQKCGEIVGVRIIRDPITMIGKGIGFVLFKDKGGVNRALQMRNPVVKKRPVNVERSYEGGVKPKHTRTRTWSQQEIEESKQRREVRIRRAVKRSEKRRKKMGFELDDPVHKSRLAMKKHKRGRDKDGKKLRWRDGYRPKKN